MIKVAVRYLVTVPLYCHSYTHPWIVPSDNAHYTYARQTGSTCSHPYALISYGVRRFELSMLLTIYAGVEIFHCVCACVRVECALAKRAQVPDARYTHAFSRPLPSRYQSIRFCGSINRCIFSCMYIYRSTKYAYVLSAIFTLRSISVRLYTRVLVCREWSLFHSTAHVDYILCCVRNARRKLLAGSKFMYVLRQ